MNKELIKKWITALRSGDYKQGKGTLAKIKTNSYTGEKTERYCCLGVLADVAYQEGLLSVPALHLDQEMLGSVEGEDWEELPKLGRAVGLDTPYTGRAPKGFHPGGSIEDYLIALNDGAGKRGFGYIADRIEKILLGD